MPDTATVETEVDNNEQQRTQGHTDVFSRAIIVTLSITRPGNARKLSSSLVEVDADKAMLKFSKELLDSPELEAIAKLDREIRKFVVDLALPSPLGEGSYLLPIPFVRNVSDQLAHFAATRETLVEAAVRAYPSRKEEARERLRSAWNPMDYPSEDRFRAAFGLSWRFTTFGPPAILSQISEELMQQEQAKFRAQMNDNMEQINNVLAAGLKDLVDRMLDRLTPGEDGKPKRFKKSTVEHLDDFFRTFSARNLGNNEELEQLVSQARQILEGVTPEALRQSQDVRSYVQNGLATIKSTLDTMVTTRSRMVVADDEEDTAA